MTTLAPMFLFLLLFVVTVVTIIRLPAIRGKQGEAVVAMRLKELPKSEYAVFNNLLIQRGEYSSQIDHVVVSEYGIFVIETKNYKGWIYGGEYSEHWTQNIWGNKYQLYNPILQNQGHVNALKYYLNRRDLPLFPVVTFSSRANVMVRTKENPVLYYFDIKDFILSKKNVLLSDADKQAVVQMLSRLPKFTRKDGRKHAQQVRYRTFKSQMAVCNLKCPKCGGNLVQRTGKYGSFHGCSNYPNCKFTTK